MTSFQFLQAWWRRWVMCWSWQHGCARTRDVAFHFKVAQLCKQNVARLFIVLTPRSSVFLPLCLASFLSSHILVMSTNANKNGLQQQCDDKIWEIATKRLKEQTGEQKRHKNIVICLWNNAVGKKYCGVVGGRMSGHLSSVLRASFQVTFIF